MKKVDNQRAQTLAEEALKLMQEAKVLQQQAQCQAARILGYQQQSDGLAFKYLAAQAEHGEHSQQAFDAKQAWFHARKSVQARYPKLHGK
ncbi:hypothetical protein [Pseudoalteromonas obscura]|uniref:Uncharacterized protein n=1 Tax=Pseudoalteromonas obscura TaxID=3048491 RepID=A0ABT7EI16_9GAMM|nr:hypothetical protein [Pseudoalteromonas sp. P94(2023)]MDK2594664.1 hypothetical protein [Pseudoalteromonas sp. P94(2023)]